MEEYLNEAISSNGSGSKNVLNIKEKIEAINLKDNGFEALTKLQNELISAAASIEKEMDTVTSKLLPIAGLLAFIFVVYVGYMWMISAGDPDKVKRAQGTLTWAIIGLIFTILVGLILKAILDAVA